MMPPIPNLTTERLLLRYPQTNDALEVFFLRSDPVVNQHVKRPQLSNTAEAQAWIEDRQAEMLQDKLFYWCITEKGNDKMIGSICLWNFSDNRQTAEVGYELHPGSQGKCIMDEALKAVLQFGFKDQNFSLVEAYTQSQNAASKNLLLRNDFVLQDDLTDPSNPKNLRYFAHNPSGYCH